MVSKEASLIIERALDTLIEAQNGHSDEEIRNDLYQVKDDIFVLREVLEKNSVIGDDVEYTPEYFAKCMKQIAAYGSEEYSHIYADDLMMRVLRSLGYEEGCETFENMARWYS